MKLFLILSLLVLAVSADVWLDEALSFQRELTKDVPIDKVSRPCAHNAFDSLGNLPSVIVEYQNLILFRGSISFNSQYMTLPQLLDAGIRHIQIEVHYVEDFNKTLVCHHLQILLDFCPIIEGGTGMTCEEATGLFDIGLHTGCHPLSYTWEQQAAEIGTWVEAHPNDILVVELIDHFSGEPNVVIEQFVDPFEQYLAPHALTNEILTEFRAGPPHDWPSAAEMTTLGKNLIVTGTSAAEVEDYVVDLTAGPATPVANFSSEDCNNETPVFTSFYESTLKLLIDILDIYINYDESVDTGSFDTSAIEAVVDCGFTPCVDQVDFTKLAANVWTWDTGLSTTACQENMCAVLAVNEDRWSHQPCNASYALACQSDSDGSWSVTGTAGSKTSAAACEDGYTFTVPHTSQDNAALKAAIALNGGNGVWLNVDLTFDGSHALCSYVAPNSGAISSASLFLTLGALLVSLFVSRL